jgi:hypothetical protein
MKPTTLDKLKMPNVVGMGVRDAVYLLESMGYIVNINGKGAISAQSIKAGTPTKKGTPVLLTLSLPEVMIVSQVNNSMDTVNVAQAVKDSIDKMIGKQPKNNLVKADTIVKDKKKIDPKDKKKVDKKSGNSKKDKTDKKKPKDSATKPKDKKTDKKSKKENKVKKSEKNN